MKFLTLFHKEILENIRNYKLISIVLIFAFFGLASPLAAYYIPDIMAYATKSQNIKIEIPPPTYNDALLQYVKNISQMCVFILIIINMGIVAGEKDRGTAVFLLVKPVSRKGFIVAKLASVLSIAALALTTSCVLCALYTYLFFDAIPLKIFILQNLLIYLYLACILSVTVMFSSLFSSQIPAGILTFFVWILFTLFSQFGTAGYYSPDHLIGNAASLTMNVHIDTGALLSSVFIIIISITVAIFAFERWEPNT